jgi:hypothetical protein
MPALPLVLPVTVQLVASTGTCWSAAFEADGVLKIVTGVVRRQVRPARRLAERGVRPLTRLVARRDAGAAWGRRPGADVLPARPAVAGSTTSAASSAIDAAAVASMVTSIARTR